MGWRWLAAGLALACAALGRATTAGAETASTFDWQVVVITAGSHGAQNVFVGQSFVGSGNDNEQVFVVGVGEPAEHASYGFSADVPWDPSTPAFTTTHTVGGVDFTLAQQSSTHDVWSSLGSTIPHMAPGETMAIVDATAHVRLTNGDVTEKVERGSLARVRTYRGTGTGYLRFADPTQQGAAAAVGPVAAGTVDAQPTMSRAVVGVSTYYSDGEVNGTWKAPTGPPHPFKSYFTPVSACADLGNWFSGPAGRWSWHLQADMVTPGRPVFAAYAPVGNRLAKLFPPVPPFTNGSPCTGMP